MQIKTFHSPGKGYALILGLTALWCLAFTCVPFLAKGNTTMQILSAGMACFFSPICHQVPERSFYIAGQPLAVCMRCTAIYGGFLLGVIVYPYIRGFHAMRMPPKSILLLGTVPTVCEYILFHLIWRLDLPWLRIIAGLILGITAAFYVIPAVFQIFRFRT